jgi:hypothetical protein
LERKESTYLHGPQANLHRDCFHRQGGHPLEGTCIQHLRAGHPSRARLVLFFVLCTGGFGMFPP